MLDFEEELEILRIDFLQDLDSRLVYINEALVEIEKGNYQTELLKNVYRALHNLKGTASTLGFMEISTIVHRIEDLSEASSCEEVFNKQYFKDVFALLDVITILKKAYQKRRPAADIKIIAEKALQKVKEARILVFVESKTVKSYLSSALKQNDLSPVFMPDAISTLNRLLLEPIDILITSLENSVIDGLNLIKMLKVNSKTSKIKAILLTSSELKEKENAPDLILKKEGRFPDKVIKYIRSLS